MDAAWALGQGPKGARALGHVGVPTRVVHNTKAYWREWCDILLDRRVGGVLGWTSTVATHWDFPRTSTEATHWDFPRSSSFFFSMKYARISLARWR